MTEFEFKLEQAKSAVTRGKLSRRDFMTFAVAGGLSIAAANSLFIRAARAQAKPGGHFRVGLGHGNTTDTFDPATWAHGMNFAWGKGLTGAPLVRVDPKGGCVPYLAESFEPSDGAKKWVFKIRSGVTFHNGKTLTADDVVGTVNYHIGPDSKSPGKAYLAGVASVKADGADTVIFELKGADADFPYNLTNYQFPILSIVDGKPDLSGNGAGPYVLDGFEPGVKVHFKRNPNAFAPGNFDEVTQLSILDPAARTNAFLAGEVDFIDRADLKTIDLLKSAPGTEIYNVSGYQYYNAPMLTDVAPFDKLEVRQALKWAINRQDLVDKVLFGYGKPGNDSPIASAMKFAFNPEPVYGYDPDKAKSLLKQAGMENLKVDLSAADAAFAGSVDCALLMAEHAKAAGIEINVIREPNDGYWDNVWIKKPWSHCYWGGRPTADAMLTVSLAADAAWNDTRWKNPRFNELLPLARAETDDAKRTAMYAEMQQLVHDDGGQMVLMFSNYVGALSTKVAHGDLNADNDHDGGYMYDRWWFA
ncbi:MAG: ABC transporter substrate-binding protein [Proteobacteria bacterium]|nr:ABC transporter substrate-binding protein [Pseudomonadota bacterium]